MDQVDYRLGWISWTIIMGFTNQRGSEKTYYPDMFDRHDGLF